MKKVLAMFLTVALVVNLIPTQTFAFAKGQLMNSIMMPTGIYSLLLLVHEHLWVIPTIVTMEIPAEHIPMMKSEIRCSTVTVK